MEEKQFDLVPILEPKTKSYCLKSFDEIKNACEDFIHEEIGNLNLESMDEATYKAVKESRTNIRKKQNQIKDVRLACNEIAMGTFNAQTKELESMLKENDDKLKEYVDTYDRGVKGKIPAPKKIKLTIKGYDMATLEKVKEYALKKGLEAVIE